MKTSTLERPVNVIGDIAGRYSELRLLLDKMPDGIPVSVGDMVDRGRNSKEVLDFFRLNGMAVLGNHEHILIHYYRDTRYYEPHVWALNGGLETLQSFTKTYLHGSSQFYNILNMVNDYYRGMYVNMDQMNLAALEILPTVRRMIPEDYIVWLEGLPMALESHDSLITHAPVNPVLGLEKSCQIPGPKASRRLDDTVLWNRGSIRRSDKFQIYGHNSFGRALWNRDQTGCFGIGLDSSKGNMLSGIHLPTREIFTQEYLT